MSSAYADVHSQYSLDQTLYTQKVYPAVKVVYPVTGILGLPAGTIQLYRMYEVQLYYRYSGSTAVLVGLLVVWYRYVLYYVLGLVVATAIVLLLL